MYCLESKGIVCIRSVRTKVECTHWILSLHLGRKLQGRGAVLMEMDLENAVRRTESVGFYEQACNKAPGERSHRIWGLALAVHVCTQYHVLYPQNSAQPYCSHAQSIGI